MKKTLASLICATLLLGLLAGCGSKTAGGGQASGENGSAAGGQQTVSVYLLEKKANGANNAVLHTYAYDEVGNLVEENDDYRDYRYVYVYDENNKVVEWTRYRKDGTVHQHNTYQYDDKGNETMLVEDYSEYHFEYKSSYNDKGQLTEVVCTRNGELFDTDTYVYDDQGRVLEFHDGGFSDYYYIYEGNTTRKQDVESNGNIHSEQVYTYDDNGKLIKEEYFERGELSYYYEYKRDGNGKALEVCNYDMNDGAAELETQTVNTYDGNGNLADKKVYKDGQLKNHYVYSYVELKVSPERAEVLRLQAEKDAE